MSDKMGRKLMPLGERLKHYCYLLNLCRHLRIEPCGYQLQKSLQQLPKDLGDKTKLRNNKWDRYFNYPKNKTPNLETMTLIAEKLEHGQYILHEPFWVIISSVNQGKDYYYEFLIKSPLSIKKLLFSNENPYKLKERITPRTFRAITKQKSTLALAVLLSLIKLHQLGAIYVSQIITLVLEVILLLRVCSTIQPIDLVSVECYELVITFIHGESEAAKNLLSDEDKYQYRKQQRELSRIIRTLCLYGGSANEPVLAYWLLRANDEDIINDFALIDKGVVLTENAHGILWVLNHAMADVNTRDKIHLQFIFNLFTSDRQLEDQN
jgi:hypothetical protein